MVFDNYDFNCKNVSNCLLCFRFCIRATPLSYWKSRDMMMGSYARFYHLENEWFTNSVFIWNKACGYRSSPGDNSSKPSYLHSIDLKIRFNIIGANSLAIFCTLTLAVSFIMSYTSITVVQDDVIKWKHFPPYWSFVQGIHRFDVFFGLRLNKRLG